MIQAQPILINSLFAINNDETAIASRIAQHLYLITRIPNDIRYEDAPHVFHTPIGVSAYPTICRNVSLDPVEVSLARISKRVRVLYGSDTIACRFGLLLGIELKEIATDDVVPAMANAKSESGFNPANKGGAGEMAYGNFLVQNKRIILRG